MDYILYFSDGVYILAHELLRHFTYTMYLIKCLPEQRAEKI